MDNTNASQKLDYNFLERFLEFDAEKGMFKLEDKAGLYPAYYYEPEDMAIYVEAFESKELTLITFEIHTLGDLEKWYDLMFKRELPF